MFYPWKRINHFNSLSRIQSAQHESMLFPTTFSGPHYSFLRLVSTSFTNSLHFPPLCPFHHNLFLGDPHLPLSFNVHLYFIVHHPSVPVYSVPSHNTSPQFMVHEDTAPRQWKVYFWSGGGTCTQLSCLGLPTGTQGRAEATPPLLCQGFQATWYRTDQFLDYLKEFSRTLLQFLK